MPEILFHSIPVLIIKSLLFFRFQPHQNIITDEIGLGKIKKAGVPKIMVPTTAGTGAEVTFTAVFINEKTGSKGGMNGDPLYPDAAICTDTMPWTAADGSFYWGTEWPLPEGLNNHPRSAGNYTRFFRKWVRERGVLSWMDAIRKTALIPCQILENCVPGMKKKGRIQPGMDADIIVFDPETVTDRADFKNPAQTAKGMKHVIVNGTFLIRDEALDTSALPGRGVRAPIVEA